MWDDIWPCLIALSVIGVALWLLIDTLTGIWDDED